MTDARVLYHSSVRIAAEGCVIYVDPFKIRNADHDADIILITHDHFDHFSPEDIGKIINENTTIAVPSGMKKAAAEITSKLVTVEPGSKLEINGVHIEAVPAYNVGKPFHTKGKGWVGYIAELGGERFYIAGDTDLNDDVKQVKCDVAFVPIGGTYTMDAKKAAELVNIIKPRLAIPTHYGDVAGKPADADAFASLVDSSVEVEIQLKF